MSLQHKIATLSEKERDRLMYTVIGIVFGAALFGAFVMSGGLGPRDSGAPLVVAHSLDDPAITAAIESEMALYMALYRKVRILFERFDDVTGVPAGASGSSYDLVMTDNPGVAGWRGAPVAWAEGLRKSGTTTYLAIPAASRRAAKATVLLSYLSSPGVTDRLSGATGRRFIAADGTAGR